MLSLDTVFDLLSDERRRYSLYYLKEQNRPAAVDELAETLAYWEENARTNRGEKHVKVELHHKHLPKATEVEDIEYKPDAGVVELQGPSPTFNVITVIARVIEQPAED